MRTVECLFPKNASLYLISSESVHLSCLHKVEIKMILLETENHFSCKVVPVRLPGGVGTLKCVFSVGKFHRK